MSSIFDRLRIEAYSRLEVYNTHAHSSKVASVAVRVAAASYAFTSDLIPNSKESTDYPSEIPFKSLSKLIADGKGRSRTEWYGGDGGGDSFSLAVIGGAAYGVLLNDLIFVGFRGTSNKADWAINLFGLDRSGPLKVPLCSDYYNRRMRHPWGSFGVQNGPQVHAGMYRVSQALCCSLSNEIDKLKEIYRNRGNKNSPAVILTGHSLGGALALLSGLELNHNAIYTFGMPRVCEAGVIAELPACHFRYVLEGDPVPNLPPESFGLHHDMPCLMLDPYRGLEKPGLIAKAIRGFRSGTTLAGSLGAAAKAVLAREHDMELYVDAVMMQ